LKILLAEANYARRLLADRAELLELSKEWGRAKSHDERVDFFAQMKAQGRIMLAPKPGQDPTTLYTVDANGTAHIQIVGQLTPVAEQDVCGGYTAEALTEYGYIVAATQAASADSRVQAIDYHVSSPGGYLAGLFGAIQAVAAASVPTRAIVGDMAASAAYWLASAMGDIQAESPASRFGSIGVLAEDYNTDGALAAKGIQHTVFTSTDAPLKHADTLTPEGRAQVVAELDQLHAIFRAQVAEGRGVSEDVVNSDFGRGALLTAEAALAAGMIDGIQPQAVLGKTKSQMGGVAASASQAIKPKGSVKMTLEEMKAQHPEAYAAAVAVGHAQGVQAEQNRVRELAAWHGVNADVDKVVEEATASGKTYNDVASQLAAAAARSPKRLNGDNPPAAGTAEAPAGAVSTQVEGLTDDEVAVLMRGNPAQGIKGMTIDQIRASVPLKKGA
jgi:ClpP class serine protease